MAKRVNKKTTVNWNEHLYTFFCQVAMLSEFDRECLRMRIMQYTLSEIADALKCDESTASRGVTRLREIYDAVQPYYPDDLPKRTTSQVEEYMDTH